MSSTRGRFVEYLLSRPDVQPVWHEFINHPFVLAMGNGTLPLESFKGYLVQDYLYLVHFARANALAAYKAKNIADIAAVSLLCSFLVVLPRDPARDFGFSTSLRLPALQAILGLLASFYSQKPRLTLSHLPPFSRGGGLATTNNRAQR